MSDQRFLVEVIGGPQGRFVVEFRDPRQQFCDYHNSTVNDGSVARVVENPRADEVADLDFRKRSAATA